MKTALTTISELSPGDKIFLPWPVEKVMPEWHKLPEVLTVKKIENNRTVLIEESGGVCLQTDQFNKVIDAFEPEAGDTITFKTEWFNDLDLMEIREFTAVVERISRDPMKYHKPKCSVTIENEQYGITFDMISKIEKAKPQIFQTQLF